MHWEIADSDDELDIIIPIQPVKVDIATAKSNKVDLRDPLADTNFDDFLTPTQQISSYYDGKYDSEHHVIASNCDSSTERFLREVAPPSSSLAPASSTARSDNTSTMGGKQTSNRSSKTKKRLRTQTEQEEGHLLDKSVHSKSAKRTKLNAFDEQSPMDSGEVTDMQALIAGSDKNTGASQLQNEDTDAEHPSLVSIDPRSEYTSPLDLSLSATATSNTRRRPVQMDNHSEQAQDGGTPSVQSYTPYTSFFNANMQGVTTSRSSMGGYQSFNIHPGELGMGYSDINPFGQPTQVTDLDDTDSAEVQAITEHFRKNRSNTKSSALYDTTDERFGLHVDTIQEMQTSSIDKVELGRTSQPARVEELPKDSPSYSQITDREAITNETIEPVSLPETIPQLQPKKRGRKRKQPAEEEVLSDAQNNLDELHVDTSHTVRSVRAGTIDSVSNASEISHGTTNGRSVKKRKPKKADLKPEEVLSKKLPSSDLGLNDKAIIGLSPERYVPRPSRRRGRAEPEPETVIVEEVKVAIVDSDEVDATATPIEEPVADESTNTKARGKGRKGKKSKGKQSDKSSAIIPERREDPVVQDANDEKVQMPFGDEEAVESDEEPLKADRESGSQRETKTDDPNVHDDDDVMSKRRHVKVVVEIPSLPKPDDYVEIVPPIPGPKKRGRKRKKIVEEVSKKDQDDKNERQALAENDPNIQQKESVSHTLPLTGAQEDEEDETTAEVKSKTSTSTELMKPKSATQRSSKSAAPTEDPASTTPSWQTKSRIGLSKRYSIPSLLRKIDRNKEPPKIIERKEKLSKRQFEEREQERIAREEAEAEGREYKPSDVMRGADGMLMEWDF